MGEGVFEESDWTIGGIDGCDGGADASGGVVDNALVSSAEWAAVKCGWR